MKKFIFTLVLAGMFWGLAAAENAPAPAASRERRAGEFNWGEALVLYLPNRILDILDCFTLNLGVGPVAEARLMGTRLADCGAGIGMSFKACKSHHRQYGFCQEQGFYWSLVCIGEEDYGVIAGTTLVDKYTEVRTGVPLPTMRNYNFFEGPRDFWAIGGSLGLLIDGDLYLHPLEWLDAAAGIFLFDPSGDDLRFDDFR